MGSIGTSPDQKADVAVATSDGKAYYKIISFLKHVGVPYRDLLLSDPASSPQALATNGALNSSTTSAGKPRLVITTRKERIHLVGDNVVCIEDLGDDFGLAKEKLLSVLYPLGDDDSFIVGIDPGQRTGIAAFFNHREIESTVATSLDETILRVSELLENSPRIRRIVRIGYGNPNLALRIAKELESRYQDFMTIQLVDERGTSNLSARRKVMMSRGTRDQRAAKLIAFREGQEFQSGRLPDLRFK